MRVLHVIPGLDPKSGGPSTALQGLALAQRKAGLQVSVLSAFCASDDPSTDEMLKRHDIGIRSIGPTRGRLARHPDISRAVDECIAAADIVHLHAIWEEVLHQAARTAKRRGVPYIIRPCGMLDPWSLRQNRWVKKLMLAWRVRKNLNSAAALHFTTAAERDLVAPLQLQAEAVVEPNGVDLAEFQRLPPAGTFRSRFEQLGDRPILLFLSRLHPKKGLDLLVPAFAKVAGEAKLRGAMLVIAGPDTEGHRSQIEALVTAYGISDRVIFTGMLQGEQRIAALAEAALFILPSYQENFGNVVVESLAAGTPVIISDQVNLQSEIKAARVGGVVPTRIEPLAAEILRWMGENELYQWARERARPFVWEHYDWLQIAERWKMRYQDVIADQKRV